MTTIQISKDGFKKDCHQLKDKTIISFQVKISNYKTNSVVGNLLNDKASELISKAKVGDSIMIFNIKVKSKDIVDPITITIKI